MYMVSHPYSYLIDSIYHYVLFLCISKSNHATMCMIFDQTSFRQPTLWYHNLCLGVLPVHGNKLRACFFYQGILHNVTIFLRTWHIAAVGTSLMCLVMARYWPEINPSSPRQRTNVQRIPPSPLNKSIWKKIKSEVIFKITYLSVKIW